jgi:hypothetical protein
MKDKDALPKRVRDTQGLARLSARLLRLGAAGDVVEAEEALGVALDAAFDLGNEAARYDLDEAAPTVNAALSPALGPPNGALRVLLVAWAEYAITSVSAEEMKRVARVMVEFAGAFAWLAELEDAPAMVRFSIDECERNDGISYGLEADSPQEEGADAVQQAMESVTLTTALQHMSDMGVRGVGFNLPGHDEEGWSGTAITPCECKIKASADVAGGPHLLFVRLSNLVGQHLQRRDKQPLDS